jgi:hypothetical protein
MFRAHQVSPARTEFRSFPGRTHWLIAQDGWQEIAQACIDWIGSLSAGESSRSAERATSVAEEVSMRLDRQIRVSPGPRIGAD